MTDDPKLNSPDPRRRARGLMGPVMMITVGVLFLIGEFTRYSFGDLWPILLIVAGGVIFAESMASRTGRTGS
jgi:hypothetical protein